MDYKEKYDEAVKRAKAMIKVANNQEEAYNSVITIFPELAESGDEKIRKALITLLQHFCKGYRVPGLDFPVSYKDMLAWLEKQSEISPSEDELEALRIAAYEPYKNWSEKLQSLYMKLSHCKQGEQKPLGKSALEAAKEEKVDNQNCIKPADKVELKFHEGEWITIK